MLKFQLNFFSVWKSKQKKIPKPLPPQVYAAWMCECKAVENYAEVIKWLNKNNFYF